MEKQPAPKNLPKKQVVQLESYPEVMERFQLLAKKYSNLVVTKETYKEGLKARSELREERYLIQNIIKNNKGVLNVAKKKMESDGAALIDVVFPIETEVDTKLKAIEAEKERIKAEKEAERQKIQAERIEKISKIQSEFTSAIIAATTTEQCDEIKKQLLSFEVTEEEFGDLSLSCKQTISNLEFSINEAGERIEKEIEAGKQLILNEAKRTYAIESGEIWHGEENVETIRAAIAMLIHKKEKARVINEYHELGGEGNVDDNMTLDELVGYLSTLKFELAEFAKQKREEKKAAEKAKEQLAVKRLDVILEAGIDDLDWVARIQANAYPDKMIEDLTEVEFETFLTNLIKVNSEITEVDFEEIPVDNPIVETIPELGELKSVEKNELIDGEFVSDLKIISAGEAIINYVTTNEPELNSYTRHSPTNWTVVMGESSEPVYDCKEIEALFQAHINK